MFQSIDTLAYAVHTFTVNCVNGITANREHCAELVERSVGIATALCPHIGYREASEIAKEALGTGKSVRSIVISRGLLSEDELNEILDPMALTRPGIAGRELLSRPKT